VEDEDAGAKYTDAGASFIWTRLGTSQGFFFFFFNHYDVICISSLEITFVLKMKHVGC
jgi:hypothetical protein